MVVLTSLLCRRPAPRQWLPLLLAAWAAAWPTSVAAATNPPPETARFLHLTVEDGLSQNTVRAILQDRYGFLWFATEEGLNRYDGYKFLQFKHQPGDPRSLPNDTVTALAEDRSGRLWVGTRGGVSVYDAVTETFEQRLRVQEEVMGILEDARGRLWVATAGEGLFRIDPGQTTPARYRADGSDASLADNTIYALLEDKRGDLWLGTFGGGLDRLEPDSGRVFHYRHDPSRPDSLAHNEVWSLAQDSLGRIWVGTNGGGASVLDSERRGFRHHRQQARSSQGLKGDIVSALYVDRDGSVWLGTDSGLNRYGAETDTFVLYSHASQNPESLGWNNVRAVYEDRQGNLWVSTFASGLNWLRRNENPFQHLRAPHEPAGPAGGSVASFLQDRDGYVWIGGEGWVHRFDPARNTFVGYRLGSAPALTLEQDRRGRIWVGTWGRGVLVFDPAAGTFTPFRNTLENPATREDEQVWDIHLDEDGWLWLATDDGVFRLDPETGRAGTHYVFEESNPNSLGHNRARAFHRDDANNLWIATLGGGLSVLGPDRKTFTHHRHDPGNPRSISNDWVVSLHRDRQGRLWAGTFNGGLNLFEPQSSSFQAFGHADGLPSNAVYAILEDAGGRLWLSTNRGLCRFDPKSRRSETFDTTNGLQSLQFNLGARLMTRAGAMMFGSWNGFYAFDPSRIKPDPRVPPIVFTSLKVLNQPTQTAAALAATEQITLGHNDKMLTVEFMVLDYTFPRRNAYMYKLEGFDDNWIFAGERRDVSFTSLPPGSYVLRVKGSNSDGVWDDAGRSLRIVVKPPFWATWWFRSGFVMLFLGAIGTVHMYRIRLHEARERDLQERVDEAISRIKILKGLLPICATCKKVRDDKGYWSQIESYLRTHSEADFSHGICPDCITKYWGNTRAAAALKKRES